MVHGMIIVICHDIWKCFSTFRYLLLSLCWIGGNPDVEQSISFVNQTFVGSADHDTAFDCKDLRFIPRKWVCNKA